MEKKMNRMTYIVLTMMCIWMTACTTPEPAKPANANPLPKIAGAQPKTEAKDKTGKFRMPQLSHPDS